MRIIVTYVLSRCFPQPAYSLMCASSLVRTITSQVRMITAIAVEVVPFLALMAVVCVRHDISQGHHVTQPWLSWSVGQHKIYV